MFPASAIAGRLATGESRRDQGGSQSGGGPRSRGFSRRRTWSRILRMTRCSVMKAMIFISAPHSHSKGRPRRSWPPSAPSFDAGGAAPVLTVHDLRPLRPKPAPLLSPSPPTSTHRSNEQCDAAARVRASASARRSPAGRTAPPRPCPFPGNGPPAHPTRAVRGSAGAAGCIAPPARPTLILRLDLDRHVD